MKTRLLAMPALLVLALAGGPSPAQAQPAQQAASQAQPATVRLARADRKFIEDAAGAGMFEVHVAQLAVSKADDGAVKGFASMLVDQHTAANKELARIAEAKKVELPAAPRRSLRRDIDKLGKKSGAEFDRAFVREVGIEAHEKDIERFQDARKHVKDADLKAFIDKTLPVLQDHLAAAKALPQARNNR